MEQTGHRVMEVLGWLTDWLAPLLLLGLIVAFGLLFQAKEKIERYEGLLITTLDHLRSGDNLGAKDNLVEALREEGLDP